jgi:predicted nucleotidyltransferase
MTDRREVSVRILEQNTETLQRSKDEEYAYWQSRPPRERLAAMRELSAAFFEEHAMKLKLGADFRDLLSAFRACSVKYLIIGGWAVSVHAQPRATQDMDIFVSSDKANLETVYEALLRFGAPLENVDKGQFLRPGAYYRIGAPPHQVDIFPGIPGVQFEACWPKRVEVALEGGLSAQVISAEDLIAAKTASGREQDLADVQAIRRAQQQKPKV